MSRIAAIDLGTNTVRILVAEPDGSGFNQLFSDQIITRLGEGLHLAGRLGPDAIRRTAAGVAELLRKAEGCRPFALAITATSAARDARNTAELDEMIRSAAGEPLRVISWEEEARLTLLGAGMVVRGLGRFILFDIGGGSTEYILSDKGGLAAGHGTDLGVVRLAETYLTKHPVAPAEYGRMAGEIEEKVDAAFTGMGARGYEMLVGTAGTVTSLAAIAMGMVEYSPARINNFRLTSDAVESIRERLFAMTIEERSRIPFIGNGREDLIIPGIAIIQATMKRAGKDFIVVSDFGLREGLILDMARAPR